jgi:hypothetical protein
MHEKSNQFTGTSANEPLAASVVSSEPEFAGINETVRWSGIGRTSLFALIKEGRIRSINLRQPGRARGRRLIHLASLRDYLLAHAEGGHNKQ